MICVSAISYDPLAALNNICPTDIIDAVIERGGKRDLVPMRWGLIPNWWKKPPRKFRRPSTRGPKQ
jgi:putative SOS response-associated peptidase YedK